MPDAPALDPRTTLARPDLAEAALEGVLAAPAYRATTAMRCVAASTPLLETAGGTQQDQLLFGEIFDVLDVTGGWAWGRSRRDAYVGFVRAEALAEPGALPTHRVAVARAEVGDGSLDALPMNALVAVAAIDGDRAVLAEGGWMAVADLADFATFEDDIVGVANDFLGAPYDWGGRRIEGIDCSGLVQAALYACGRGCPRDSDQQAAELGEAVDAPARGDLVFWRGHVALLTDAETVIHANGHHKAVAIEPLAAVNARMGETGAFRRLRAA